MRELYTSTSNDLTAGRILRTFRRICLVLAAFLAAGTLSAQTLSWTGLVDSDALKAANWEPQQVPGTGMTLVIDSAYKFTNLPVFSGGANVTIAFLDINPTGEMTIEFSDSLVVFEITDEIPDLHGTINIDHGKFRARRVEIEDTNSVINVTSGGILEVRKYLFFGSSTDPEWGGYLNVSGTGLVVYTAEQASGGFGRFPTAPDEKGGIITLNPNGRMELKGDYRTLLGDLISTDQLVTTPEYEIVVKYDAAGNWTTVFPRDRNAFIVEPPSPQFLVTNETGTLLALVQNDAWAATSTFDWQYSTTSGSGYTSFTPAESGDTYLPVFTIPGKYFVVCTGDGVRTSNEVIFYVASDLLSVSPDEMQYLRPGLNGAMLTVTKDASITGVEWKWSLKPGEDYNSFTPEATADEFTPLFNDEGLYYVSCIGTDGSNSYPSKDVQILVNNVTYTINWLGVKGNSAYVVENWYPLANIDRNNAKIGVRSTYTDSIVFGNSGENTYLANILIAADATATVDKEADTLRISKTENYDLVGTMYLTSGAVSYQDLRLERGTINVSGGEFIIRASYFMIGNKALSTGGFLNISGDGKFTCYGSAPGRFSNDHNLSIITITENGLLQVAGDWRSGAQTAINNGQLVSDAGSKIVVEYDAVKNITLVTSRSLTAFGIAPEEDQKVAVGENIAQLSTVNDAGVLSYAWKYSTTRFGDYVAFDPAQTGNSLSVSFAAAGDYFILCEGTTASETFVSNKVYVQVIGVTVAPADPQYLEAAEEGTALTVTETVTPESREWMFTTTSGSGYAAVVPPNTTDTYSPLFLTTGTYYVVCASTFGSKTINSNEVVINVMTFTVSIAPTADQVIEATKDGTALTVTESFTADSREWMFTTTPGSGYQAFSPAQTGTSYTPKFATAGVYYVVCASTIGQKTIISNEVKIDARPLSIADMDKKMFTIYPNPAVNTFYLDAGELANYDVEIFDMLGKSILVREFRGVSGPQELMLGKKGVFFVHLRAGDRTQQTKLVLR